MAVAEQIDTRFGKAQARGGVTPRSVVWGLATAAVVAYAGNLQSVVLHASSMVKSSYPVALILYFCIWVAINALLGVVNRRWMFTRTEMLVIFATAWIASMMPAVGWMGYLMGSCRRLTFSPRPRTGGRSCSSITCLRGGFPILYRT